MHEMLKDPEKKNDTKILGNILSGTVNQFNRQIESKLRNRRYQVQSQRDPHDKQRHSLGGYNDRERVIQVFDKYTDLKSQNALSREAESNLRMFSTHIENANRKPLTDDEVKETYGAFMTQGREDTRPDQNNNK